MAAGPKKTLFSVLLVTCGVVILFMSFVTNISVLTPSLSKVIRPMFVASDFTSGDTPQTSSLPDYDYTVDDEELSRNDSNKKQGIHSVQLFKKSGICNVTTGTKDASGSEFYSTGNHRMCVAVLTGYPDVARKEYVRRVLANLRHDAIAPEPYDLHVFCQGKCHATVCDELGYSAIYHEIEKTVHMEVDPKRQSMKDILYPMRWYYLSQNYFFMFEQLFVRRKRPYRQCVIIEDDLLLSPDALYYARAGMDLMDKDDSVFSVSFSNDNSHIPHARELGDFRRIDHFSGLGFMISQRAYMSHLRNAWVRNKAWDIMVQWMFNRKGSLVSIQPEVMRAIHESDKKMKNLAEVRKKYQRSMIADGVLDEKEYSLDSYTEENYDRLIREHIIQATAIDYVVDAAFFKSNKKLIYTNCTDKEDMDRIMSRRHMVGIGLGKVVRGVYKHTVFLRIYYAKVLVVCKISPFYNEIRPRPSFDPGTLEISLHKSVKRAFLAPIYAFDTSYVNVISDVNQSCADACAVKNLNCYSYGIKLLDEGCEVVYYFFKECLTCKKTTENVNKIDWPKPDIDNEQTCRMGALLSPCDARGAYSKRLCGCEKPTTP